MINKLLKLFTVNYDGYWYSNEISHKDTSKIEKLEKILKQKEVNMINNYTNKILYDIYTHNSASGKYMLMKIIDDIYGEYINLDGIFLCTIPNEDMKLLYKRLELYDPLIDYAKNYEFALANGVDKDILHKLLHKQGMKRLEGIIYEYKQKEVKQ